MNKVSNIAADEIKNVLESAQLRLVNLITAEEMKRIMIAFKDSGDEFFKLESFGIFLDEYIISGGEVTKTGDNTIQVEETTLSFMNFLWTIYEVDIEIPSDNGVYKVYFSGEFNKMLYDNSVPSNGFEFAEIIVEDNIIKTINDTRGPVGGIRFAPSIVIDGGEW
ncbi:MAG: hypothetical protein M0Q14_10670 [Tissierellaceae bacterium]|nr:hypothetical protein [Tissierellaceae bacterium]